MSTTARSEQNDAQAGGRGTNQTNIQSTSRSTDRSEPLISVLMVNYNHADTIAEAVRSVLGQTWQNLELVIVDDGSTDESVSVVEPFLSDPRVRLHRLPRNEHICAATNVGFTLVSGTWLARIDSDDVWYPNRLERQMEVLALHPEYDICFSWADWIDENGNDIRDQMRAFAEMCDVTLSTQREFLRRFYYEGNCLMHSSVLMRMDLRREIGDFNLSYRMLHDFDFWVRAAKRHNLLVIRERLIAMRHFMNQDNRGRNSSEETKENEIRTSNEFADIRAHFFEDMPDDVLVDAFGEDFRRADSRTPEELACERAFLLCRPQAARGVCVPPAGLRALAALLAHEDSRRLLEERYDFTVHDFYELSGRHAYFDTTLQLAWARERRETQEEIRARDARIGELSRTVGELQAQVGSLNAQLESLTNLANEREARVRAMESSTSWRVTKPLRALGARLDGAGGAQRPASAHKTVFVHAFLAANLGDDLFVRMLCARYPHVTFQVAATDDYRERFADVPNLEVHAQDEFSDLVRAADAVAHIGGCVFVQHQKDFSSFYDTDRFLADNSQGLVCLGGNFGPYLDDSYLQAYRELFRRYAGVTFRDRYSAGLFPGYDNVAYAPDIVFGYPAHQAEKRRKAVFAPIRMEGREGPFGISAYADAYNALMAQMARELIARDYDVCLVSFCEGQGDEEVCAALSEALSPHERERVRTVCYRGSVEEVAREFEDAACVVATRFHAMVLGFVHGCRTLPVVYDQKTEKVLEDLSYAPAVRLDDLAGADAGRLVDLLLAAEPLDVAPLAAASEGHFRFLDRILGQQGAEGGAVSSGLLGRVARRARRMLRREQAAEPAEHAVPACPSIDELLPPEPETRSALVRDFLLERGVAPLEAPFEGEPWRSLPLEDRVRAARAARASGRRVVLLVYELESGDPATFRYFGYNVAQRLSSSPSWAGAFLFVEEIDQAPDLVTELADLASAAVLVRCRIRPDLNALCKRLKASGTRLAYLIDDLALGSRTAPRILEAIANDPSNPFEIDFWAGTTVRFQFASLLTDMVIVPGAFFAGLLREETVPVRVLHSSLNDEQVEIAERVTSARGDHEGFVVGYFSGSSSHQEDFALVRDAVVSFLRSCDDARLVLGGYLKVDEELRQLWQEGRVTLIPRVDYSTLQCLQAACDVVLAPLVVDDFTNCKSGLKVFEAGVVGTCALASPSFAYEEAVEDGETGFICREPEDWARSLRRLHDNPQLCRAMGAAARSLALERYWGDAVRSETENVLDELLTCPSRALPPAVDRALGMVSVSDWGNPGEASVAFSRFSGWPDAQGPVQVQDPAL